jgi:outer membrane receptor protein involved in Fe transport
VADALVHGGNPDLKPRTAWATELDADLHFPGNAALRVRTFHQLLDDVVDFVPVGPSDDDARGNIGRGRLSGVEVVMRVPLDPLLPAGSLQASGTWQDSDVRDPVTGEHRQISSVLRREIQAELRQDLAAMKLSWGVAFTGESSRTDFRFTETDRTRASSSLDAFVETTALKGFKLRLQMLSILDAAQLRERRFYAQDRAGVLTGSEASRWHPGYRWLLTLSGRL